MWQRRKSQGIIKVGAIHDLCTMKLGIYWRSWKRWKAQKRRPVRSCCCCCCCLLFSFFLFLLVLCLTTALRSSKSQPLWIYCWSVCVFSVACGIFQKLPNQNRAGLEVGPWKAKTTHSRQRLTWGLSQRTILNCKSCISRAWTWQCFWRFALRNLLFNMNQTKLSCFMVSIDSKKVSVSYVSDKPILFLMCF